MVRDGEVAGMAGGLAKVRREKKILILANAKAAIAAVRRAGKSQHLQEAVNMIAEVRKEGGEVKIGANSVTRLPISWQKMLQKE